MKRPFTTRPTARWFYGGLHARVARPSVRWVTRLLPPRRRLNGPGDVSRAVRALIQTNVQPAAVHSRQVSLQHRTSLKNATLSLVLVLCQLDPECSGEINIVIIGFSLFLIYFTVRNFCMGTLRGFVAPCRTSVNKA